MKSKLESIVRNLAFSVAIITSSQAYADPQIKNSNSFVYYNSDSRKKILHELQDGDRFLVSGKKIHYCPTDNGKCFVVKSNNRYLSFISLRGDGEYRYDFELFGAYRRSLGLKD